MCVGLLQSYKPVLFDIEACVNRTLKHYPTLSLRVGWRDDLFSGFLCMALPGCLAELLASFLADFAADFPTILSPSKEHHATFHALPAKKFVCQNIQNPRKPCPETLYPFRLLAIEILEHHPKLRFY